REVQQITLVGASNGAAIFDLGGARSSSINWNAVTAGTLQSTLESIATVGAGNVTVIGPSAASSTATYSIVFNNNLAGINLPQLLLNNAGFSTASLTFAQQSDGALFNEAQRLAFSANSGTFTLDFDGQTTAAIAFDATSGAVQSALEALANIATGDVLVTGTPGNFGVYFTGARANQDVAELVIDSAALANTSGVTVTTTQDGDGLGINEVQAISFSATSGTFTLTFDRDPSVGTDLAITAPLAFNATSGDVQNALQAIAGGSGVTFTVTGTPGNFTATLGHAAFTNFDPLASSSFFSSPVTGLSATSVQGDNFGDEQQTLQLMNVTGGSFRLAFNGMTTASIPSSDNAASVQAALEALPTIGTGNVNVTGSAATGFIIRFTGDLGNRDVASIVPFNVSLTSGSVPVIAAGTSTVGISPESITGIVMARGLTSGGLLDTGNNVLQIIGATPLTLANYVSNLSSNANLLTDTAAAATVAGLIDFNAGNKAIVVADTIHGGRAADLVVTALISGQHAQFNKSGTGHLQLTAANRFGNLVQPLGGLLSLAGASGALLGVNAVTISADASFVVDNSGPVNNDRLANAISPLAVPTITMAGGTLEFIGNSSVPVTESIGNLTVNAAVNQPSTIKMTNQVGQPLQVTAATLAFGAGGTAMFVGGADDLGTANNQLLFTNAPTLVNNTLVNALLVGTNGLEFATHSAGVGLMAAPFVTDINAATATQNVKATSSQTLAANKTINGLMLVGDGITIDGPFTLASTQAAKIVNVGGNNRIETTGLNFGAAANVLLQTELGSGLTITSNVQGTGTLRKELSGTLTLNPTTSSSVYSGSLTVNQGVVRAQNSSAFGTSAGGVLVSSGA
ncbi:MAG: hypothetical protein JNM18_03365, partial [Planctomycetaceae bacterium]|nr:hypothetical protein [Planctomycetaceae bacterium]